MSRLMVVGGILAMSVSIAAQQAPSFSSIKSQILTFEDGLQRAVEVGGDSAAKEAYAAAPVMLNFTDRPVVQGVPLEGYGIVFYVQVPDVGGIVMFEAMLRSIPPATVSRVGDAQPSNRVGATTVTADSMAAPGAPFDARAAFRANVKTAVINAMLDNSGVLTLSDRDWLVVTYNGLNQSTQYRVNSERVILKILGADLAAFHQGRLTRDEAKEHIKESTF